MKSTRGRRFSPAAALATAWLGVQVVPSTALATNAHFLHSVGATDSAMGGSTIAAPQDVLSGLYNNVGNLTQIEGTRVDVNLEAMYEPRHVESTLGPFHGRTDSSSKFAFIPAFGVAHTPQGSNVTYFLGAIGVSGFGADYPEDDDNPILNRQVANGKNTGGFGTLYSFYQLLRITAGVAVKVTPELSLGLAPTLNYSTLSLKPFAATSPDCTPQGECVYPNGSDTEPAIGGGFLLGMHYRWTDSIALAVGYTSPQWFTKFHYNSSVANPDLDTFGKGRSFAFRLNAPQSVQFGVAWNATPELLVTSSGKWMNLADTRGLDDSGFDRAGKVRGFGWSNIWCAGLGGQYHVTPGIALRLGYNYSQNPIDDRLAMFSTPAPAAIAHHVTAGFGTAITEHVELNAAYYHAFAHSIDGPFVSPVAGAIPGSNVKSTLTEDSILLEVSFKL